MTTFTVQVEAAKVYVGQQDGEPLLWHFLVKVSSAEAAEAMVRNGEIGRQVGPSAAMRVFAGPLA